MVMLCYPFQQLRSRLIQLLTFLDRVDLLVPTRHSALLLSRGCFLIAVTRPVQAVGGA